ncbi:MAG: SRPBCC domain-containing protein [Thermoplasmata archaeon]
MQLSGEFQVSQSREAVLSYLRDVSSVISTIPEVVSSETVDQGSARVVVKAGISAIKGKFNALIKIREVGDEVEITANGSGSSGSISIKALFSPREENGITKVKWNVDMTVGGMIATMGSRVINGAVEKYVNALTESFRRRIEGK